VWIELFLTFLFQICAKEPTDLISQEIIKVSIRASITIFLTSAAFCGLKELNYFFGALPLIKTKKDNYFVFFYDNFSAENTQCLDQKIMLNVLYKTIKINFIVLIFEQKIGTLLRHIAAVNVVRAFCK